MSVPEPADYEIERELGRGDLGTVYLARSVRLARAVALKFLPAELTSDPARLDRFRREARAASALNLFRAATTGAGLHAMEATPPIPPEQFNPAMPRALAALIVRMLDEEPRRRPPAADVIDALDAATGKYNGRALAPDPPADRRI